MTHKVRSTMSALLVGGVIAILQVAPVLAAGRWG
jgi:hypothetical protein